jgi:hypothetical protein
MGSCGDLQIRDEELVDLFKKIGRGTYSTFDILKAYQGKVTRNEKIRPSKSWNASFGKVLKQLERNTQGKIIREVKSRVPIIIDGGPTTTSYWETGEIQE